MKWTNDLFDNTRFGFKHSKIRLRQVEGIHEPHTKKGKGIKTSTATRINYKLFYGNVWKKDKMESKVIAILTINIAILFSRWGFDNF